MTVLIIVLVLVLLLAGCVAVVLARRPRAEPPPPAQANRKTDVDGTTRRLAAERLGTELLERRIALDGRRGPLQGDYDLDMRLKDLEEQRRAGRISEEEFEAEKLRLLGG